MKTNPFRAFYGYKALLLTLAIAVMSFQSQAQVPANDLCINATGLTSAVTVSGTLSNALASAPTVASTCTGTPGADVWYSFVAQSAYPNIILSGTGTSLGTTNARIQLLSGACGGFTSLACTTGNFFSTASLYPTGLTAGTTYYIRIYSATVAPAGTPAWDFSITVADPPANDLCSNATALTSSAVCSPTAGTLNNAAVSIPAVATTCGTPGGDVWYSFVAQSVYPTIALSSLGANLTTTNTRIQLFSGTCGSLTSLACIGASTFNTATSYPTGLTLGTTYYIRVYSNTLPPTGGSAWDFAICVTDPPANDLCTNAVTLTSSTTCSPTAGTLSNAAVSIPALTTTCGTAGADVWYSFVAQTPYPTITLSGTGTSLGTANARIQLLDGTCGSFTSLGCVTGNFLSSASVNPAGLTPGNTYYIRVYSNTTAPTGGSAWDFSICIADPPLNDLCANAIALTSSAIANPTPGTLNNAAVSIPALATTCGTPGGDVWYSFVAQSVYPTITLSSLGASLTGTNARIQLFSGSCGSLTSLGCAATSTFYTATAYPTGLVPGTTYYVRIYSNTVAPTGGAAWDFAISVTDPPANDLCTNAVTLVSSTSCNSVTGTVNYASLSPGTPGACTGTHKYDVWYSFVAQTANPIITLSNIEANFLAQNPLIQVFSGTCGALTSIGCSTGATYTNPLGLTIGNTYFVRVYSTTAVAPATLGNFDICIQDLPPPANDDCSGAILLTSSTTCNNITSSVVNATPSTGVPGVCAGTAKYDVWYSFVAQSTNPSIKLTTIGASFTSHAPKIQLFAGTCGALTSINCAGTTYNATGLTVGATYYIRIYSITTNAVPGAAGNFDICVQDGLAPANDNCSGAVSLTPAATCVAGSSIAGTLLNATPTAGVPNDCGDPASPEVWYSFTATNTYPIITLSGMGAQLTAAGLRVQLLAGSCGSFTSIACGSSATLNTYLLTNGVGLVVGNTYYVRLYTNSSFMSGTTWGFTICITNPPSPTVEYGKSYVNITKGSGGGTIEPGDELEMRTTIAIRSNYAFNASFTGAIPANTSYVPGTLRLLTNEGQIYKQWTDAADGDPATISGSTISFNLGNGATQTMGGVIKSTDRPLAGGSFMVMVSYHVTVIASFGNTVAVGGGTFSFADAAGTPTSINFPAVTAMIYKNYGICTNTVGSNGILSENGGTFGFGNVKDRSMSANVPTNYTYITFGTGSPGDYYYGISNNTSSNSGANYSINPNDPISTNHVFSVWDIIGDHTGASNPLAGNPPADVNNGQTGGYMVVINASYRTDTAFLDTVRNLCPNTSYEYSAWFRNICRKCGIDSAGNGPTNPAYVPTGPGDTSGVHPNLTFNINGYDYYTTGDMGYTGQWVKKGFTYRTGPTETQMIINIRNNAPGGGGNDWAIDDIGVASCSPTLNVTPAIPTANVCYGDGASLSASVESYFDNYTYYVWEKSVDSGATFTATPYASSGTITPTYNGTDYVYTATGPSFIGDSTTHGNIFRLRVATTADNISDTNCSFLASRTVQVYVHNCLWLLKTDFINTTGSLHNSLANIQWTTANENGKISFEVEKSTDGVHFNVIGTVKGSIFNGNAGYSFNDPAAVSGAAYYRIKMKEGDGFKYSKVILLTTGQLDFSIRNLVNPFSNGLSFDVVIPESGNIKIYVLDNFGRVLHVHTEAAYKGLNAVNITNLGNLSNGMYALKVDWQNQSCIKRVIKAK